MLAIHSWSRVNAVPLGARAQFIVIKLVCHDLVLQIIALYRDGAGSHIARVLSFGKSSHYY